MADRAAESVVAFIDLGTNSVRILVVRLNPNRSFTVLTRQKEIVRLGEGEFERRQILPEAIDRTVAVCRRFAELARNFGAEEILAYATSAAREARNRDELLRRLKEEADLDVRVISGREEARLIYLGVSSSVDLGDRTAMFIDIGGGSTEISTGDRDRYLLLESLKAGAIRLTDQLIRTDEAGVVKSESYEATRRYVRSESIHALNRLRHQKVDLVFGTSGTIQTLAEVSRCLCRPGEPPGDLPVLTAADLARVTKFLNGLPLEKRKRVPGMLAERADIIIGGGAILEALMEDLQIREILVSDRSMRDGMLVDYLSRMEGSPYAEPISVRRRSVIQLGRSCGIDEPHALTVTRLALELFDSARDLGLHSFGDPEREILEYAAYLHDIGSFISFKGHQIHSHYIIRNADLLGFDQQEIGVLALVARYHRKKAPNKGDAHLCGFDSRSRLIVRTLAALLRYAEHLDRTHAGFVRHARFAESDGGSVRLEIVSGEDCALEVWAVQTDAGVFKKTFGRVLEIVRTAGDEAGAEPATTGS
jgi:exopolyphosphatase / guanosine-5'-triphosphate,3'-diphosphate pyrophosphatase